MTAVRVSTAEARRLGGAVADAAGGRARATRTVARAPYFTRCMKCQMVFTTQAAEDRHVDLVGGHTRFELVLEYPVGARTPGSLTSGSAGARSRRDVSAGPQHAGTDANRRLA